MQSIQIIDSPVGKLTLRAENGVIVGIAFGASDEKEQMLLGDAAVMAALQQELGEYFAGNRRIFTVPLHAAGTDFQKKVWAALRAIPYGEVRSYGQIAKAIGSPKAARAVGMACNKNPIVIVIPCHRVLGADKRLVGFGGGMRAKEILLTTEGIGWKA